MTRPIPNYLLSTSNFSTSNGRISVNELRGKKWSETMISLLGEPVGRNSEGVIFWENSKVEEVIASPEFTTSVSKAMRRKINSDELSQIDEFFLLVGCMLLYDLNKHVKAKKFTNASNLKSYGLKSYFLSYLIDHGKATEVAFERDTQLFRVTVLVENVFFVWHQPYNLGKGYIKSCTIVESDENVSDPPFVPKHNAERTLELFEQIVLTLIVSENRCDS